MYDKVKLWCERCDIGEQYPNIATYLDEANEQTNLKTGEVKTFGSLEGLKIALYGSGLSIIGSMPKYLCGSNIYTLDRTTIKKAIEKIKDNLHVSLDKARVIGLEFGTTFQMRCRPKEYLDKLGNMPRLQRYRRYHDTLYYQLKGHPPRRAFCFYDKKAEATANNMPIPDELKDANLLRCEMRVNGRLPFQLGVPEVTASTLSESDFYDILMQRYKKDYYSIDKLNQIKVDVMNEIKKVTDAIDVFVAENINPNYKDKITPFIEELKRADVFKDRVSYTRLKRQLELIGSKSNFTISDELIKELDDDFKNLGDYV